MWQRLMKWYRGLHPGWKVIAWVVPVLAVFFIFVLPWLLSSRYRAQVTALKGEAIIGEAKHVIDGAKEDVEALEHVRDEALEREGELVKEEDKVDAEIADVNAEFEKKKAKVKEQTSEEQADFFNDRYRSGR